MARAQVCRFYDDSTSATSLRRPVKRLPEFQASTGLLYASKYRRASHHPYFLHLPRSAALQIAFILGAFLLFLLSHSPRTARSAAAITAANLSGSPVLGRLGISSPITSLTPTVRFNVPHQQVGIGVSLAVVCMGRHDTLRKTIPAWLAVEDVDEIVLVDWSSDPPLEPIVRSVPGGDVIKVIRVDDEPSWVLSRAYNLAVNATSFNHVIRTDCDYQVGPNFVSAHEKLMSRTDSSAVGATSTTGSVDPQNDGKHFYAGNYNLARNENEVHLNGAVFIRRQDFLDIGGYDERIQTYGWDDEDLYSRLDRAGLKKMNISYDHVSHVQHDNTGRTQKGVKFAAVEIDFNSILLSGLKPWSRKSNNPTLYEPASSISAPNSIVIRAVEKPKALKDLVSQKDFNSAWGEAVGRRLHDTYIIPWDLVASLDPEQKENLLRRLMQRTQRSEKTKRAELDAAGRQSEMVDLHALPIPRVLLCHCMHGLGNRLRALGSCMSFAKATGRELVVIWQPGSHIEARFSDMFVNKFVILEKMPVSWPFAGLQKWDSAWLNFKFHNYMEMEGQGAVKGEVIHNLADKHMYYKGAYIMEVQNALLTNWDSDNDNLRSLIPIPAVTRMLSEKVSLGLGTPNVVGLHVRNRTLEKDIKNVNFIKEYGGEATKTMDMWRHKSGVHNFMREMNAMIKKNAAVKFFIATDTFEVIGQLEKIYGAERILSFKRSCDDRDGKCVKFALADLYALSKCKSLYGSNWSSFTEAAERLGGIKAKLAGQDFGV